MTTNNEAFEEAMQKKFGWNNTEHILHNPSEYSDMVYQHVYYASEGWQAATTEANKRMAELEREVAELKNRLNAANELFPAMNQTSNRLIVENAELQASNNRLRDGIAEIAVEAQDTYTNAALTKLLSESLKEVK